MGTQTEHSQRPVYSYDEVDVVSRQSHRGEHDDHGDEPCLGDASRPNAGCRGRDAAEGEGCGRDTYHSHGSKETRMLEAGASQGCGGSVVISHGVGVLREAGPCS